VLFPRRSSTRVEARPTKPAPRSADTQPRRPRPGFFATKVGSKSLNPVGLLFGASMTIWVIALYPLVLSSALLSQLFDRKKRRPMDFMVKLWAKTSMLSLFYRPRVVGAELMPPRDQPVLLVPNHCSYLDILTLSAYLPRPFKYISKVEILRIPFIGWAMGFAGHIALRRADRRSQLETFKDTVASLEAGNSVAAFAEGTRSPDGRLKKFKRGPFKMARGRVVPLAGSPRRASSGARAGRVGQGRRRADRDLRPLALAPALGAHAAGRAARRRAQGAPAHQSRGQDGRRAHGALPGGRRRGAPGPPEGPLRPDRGPEANLYEPYTVRGWIRIFFSWGDRRRAP